MELGAGRSARFPTLVTPTTRFFHDVTTALEFQLQKGIHCGLKDILPGSSTTWFPQGRTGRTVRFASGSRCLGSGRPGGIVGRAITVGSITTTRRSTGRSQLTGRHLFLVERFQIVTTARGIPATVGQAGKGHVLANSSFGAIAAIVRRIAPAHNVGVAAS